MTIAQIDVLQAVYRDLHDLQEAARETLLGRLGLYQSQEYDRPF